MTASERPDYTFTEDWFSARIPAFDTFVARSLAGTPCRLLEIGSYEGRCTTWLADHVLTHPQSHLETIDLHPMDTLVRNIGLTGRATQITAHGGRSCDILCGLPAASYDFIYVDANHATIPVLEDAVLSFRLAKPGGIIAFDDYLWDDPKWNHDGVPGPAIDAFLAIYATPSRYKPRALVLDNADGWQVWVRKVAD